MRQILIIRIHIIPHWWSECFIKKNDLNPSHPLWIITAWRTVLFSLYMIYDVWYTYDFLVEGYFEYLKKYLKIVSWNDFYQNIPLMYLNNVLPCLCGILIFAIVINRHVWSFLKVRVGKTYPRNVNFQFYCLFSTTLFISCS